MSGVVKKIGKVFKKIVKSKVFKVILIAAAVYFTAGIAAAAGGSAFAASLPGITAAGQAVGLAGTGAIAATTAAEVAGAALGSVGLAATDTAVSAGVMSGAADLAAGGLATEGIGATIASTAAGGSGLVAGEVLPEMLATDMIPEAVGQVGEVASTTAGETLKSTATGFGGVGTDAGVNASGITQGLGKAAGTLPEPTLFEKVMNGAKGLGSWMEKNPVVSKAAMEFGSGGLKMGIQAFAQKSQQDAAEERYQQDRVDRARLSSTPNMTIPGVATYNKGVVNSVTGVQP